MRLLIYVVMVLCANGCNQGMPGPHSGNPVPTLRRVQSDRLQTSQSPKEQGADGVTSPPKHLDAGRQVHSPIDLRAIPDGWKSAVADAARRVELPPQNRVFAVVEEVVQNALRHEIVFVLYEDGPDTVHRIGTYRVGRGGDVYRLNEMADGEEDMWVSLPSPPI